MASESGTNETPEAEAAPQQPLLKVVNANATPEEIAAIVAVFSAIGSGEAAPAKRPVSQWSANARKARVTRPHGLGGWKASSLPR
ncbi:acyl-CoA carboxylase subunit epsilon [Nocardioides cavernaquae]|uniref:Acyl-CoA carboxylase subunit epsilon n=1 Tax=Nocardioides cavernaquae TaxID=2321396 RepID=A0A3A5H985_9ACTN|nr:acyl-CoA carboxylase subunit epsilon [Nocardioides cavernaquae]RJS46601.1 acyl-CoA carboxylase subunit epsilon [Nocardioides cavernaquae]